MGGRTELPQSEGTYDTSDVAALLKCSTRYVRILITRNVIPGKIRLGRLMRFHRGIVNAWLREQAGGVTTAEHRPTPVPPAGG